jgi:hypothetical protein
MWNEDFLEALDEHCSAQDSSCAQVMNDEVHDARAAERKPERIPVGDGSAMEIHPGVAFVRASDGSQSICIGDEEAYSVGLNGKLSGSKPVDVVEVDGDIFIQTRDGHTIVVGKEGIRGFIASTGEYRDLRQDGVIGVRRQRST